MAVCSGFPPLRSRRRGKAAARRHSVADFGVAGCDFMMTISLPFYLPLLPLSVLCVPSLLYLFNVVASLFNTS